jgi:putative transposase
MSKKEIIFLKNCYKKESDAKVALRILMVLYTKKGESSWKVGEKLQYDHKAVLTWKNRYEKEGIEGLKTKPRSGKPMLLSRRQEERIRKKIAVEDLAKPWTTKRVCEMIKRETGVIYTQRHVQRMLHKWNFALLVPRPTFWQRASGEEIKRFWKKNTLLQEEISRL